MDILTLSRKDTGEEQISAPAMNQCNKSLIQNWFKSQKTFSFVSGGAQQKRLNMEMSEQQQQTELSKQRSQLSFFQSDAAFSQFFSLRWSVEVKWSRQSRHNEIWRSAACWDVNEAEPMSPAPGIKRSFWMEWWAQEPSPESRVWSQTQKNERKGSTFHWGGEYLVLRLSTIPVLDWCIGTEFKCWR